VPADDATKFVITSVNPGVTIITVNIKGGNNYNTYTSYAGVNMISPLVGNNNPKNVPAISHVVVCYTKVATGSLEVTKVFVGNGVPSDGLAWIVKVTCTDPAFETTLSFATSDLGPKTVTGIPLNGSGTNSCSVSETGKGTTPANWSLTVTYSPPDGDNDNSAAQTVSEKTKPSFTVTNTYTRLTGSLDVTKVVQGPVPESTEFEVTIECVDGDVTVPGFPVVVTFDENGDVVPPPALPLTGIPAGAECTVEETGTGGADIVTYSPDGGSPTDPPTVTITSGEPAVEVTITNTFLEPDEGALNVVKVVEGPVPPGTLFEVTIDCTVEGSSLDGFPVVVTFDDSGDLVPPPNLPLTGIPAGAECTVEETDNGGATSVAYDPNGGTPADPPTVPVVANETVLVTITNTFVEVGGEFTGSVNVAKAIKGNPPPEGTQFVINVRCIGPTVDVDEDITLVYSSQLDGSVSFQAPSAETVACTVTERDPLGGAIEASIAPNNGEVTLTVTAPSANVVVTNRYGDPQVEVGGITVTRGGTGQLPFTGGPIGDVVKAAAALLAMGAGLWLLARGRRRATPTL